MGEEKQVEATPDVLFWKGICVNDMTEMELRRTVCEMGQYIQSAERRLRTETERTVKWMRCAAGYGARK